MSCWLVPDSVAQEGFFSKLIQSRNASKETSIRENVATSKNKVPQFTDDQIHTMIEVWCRICDETETVSLPWEFGEYNEFGLPKYDATTEHGMVMSGCHKIEVGKMWVWVTNGDPDTGTIQNVFIPFGKPKSNRVKIPERNPVAITRERANQFFYLETEAIVRSGAFPQERKNAFEEIKKLAKKEIAAPYMKIVPIEMKDDIYASDFISGSADIASFANFNYYEGKEVADPADTEYENACADALLRMINNLNRQATANSKLKKFKIAGEWDKWEGFLYITVA